jgi:hypothetical protein
MLGVSKRIGLWIRSMFDHMRTALGRIADWIGPIFARITIKSWALVAALLVACIAGFSYYQARLTRDDLGVLLNSKLDELGKKMDILDAKLAKAGSPSSSASAKPQSR